MQEIENKVIAITGAGGGIGAAIALLLAERGAKVVLGDLNADALDALATRITDAGADVAFAHVFTAASLVGGLATSPGMLVAARAVQGLGAALAAPGVLALVITSVRDEAARHRSLALFSAVGVGGGSLGLVLGGLVTDLGSWRWTMFINVPIGIAVLALARRFVTGPPPPRPLRLHRRHQRYRCRHRRRLGSDRRTRPRLDLTPVPRGQKRPS
ncbi:MFS transporter [Streptomyces sp. NPDC056161]|uniref:MFS transporter n=1 Tax=Streptomyces sp. NPDC056161 TaxID=3345732 RepID=UPI0035D8B585